MAAAGVFAAASSGWAAGVPLHDGLISYWALDEGLGAIAHDTAPGGAVADHGQLRNSPAWIDGVFGAGLQFNGVNQDVLLPSSTDMNIGASAVTLAAWVKLDVLPASISGSFSGIFDANDDNYVLYLDKAANELRFKVTTAGGAAERPGVPGSMLNTTDWHHVMGVYDGEGRAKIFMNGQLVDTHAAGALVGSVRPGQTSGIGSQPAETAGFPPTSLFKGAVADVALWNRRLGAAEALYLFNGGAGRAVGAANPLIEPVTPVPPASGSTIISAHRGNSIAAPENTLSAFSAAKGFADRVEFDVYIAKDGELVVMHDSTVDRTTNGTGSIASLNYAGQIDALDAGSWFSPQFAGEKVPTMRQSIEQIFADGMTPLIERKAGPAAAYVDELTELGVLDDVVIISFDWNFLSQVRALAPNVELGALGSGALSPSVIQSIAAAGADFVNWGDSASITDAMVDAVHAAGMELHVWTVNSMGRMQQLIDFGVDGITTDDPETLRSLVPFPTAGDFNNDGVVDGADLELWATGFGMASGAKPADGDADGDGDVDGGDFLAWQQTFPSGLAAVPAPEPHALVLAVLTAAASVAPLRRARAAPSRNIDAPA